MKQPFRFHRGELNGFFLLGFVTFLNNAVVYILDELIYWSKVQFKVLSEITSDTEVAMRDTDIIGIGVFAGVFPQYFSGGVWPGMVFFTESHVVGGAERSERGLYAQSTESFNYVRTANDDYPDDIVNDASPAQRMTVVPTGTTPAGYVIAGTPLYDTSGAVIWSNVLLSPPGGGVAYDTYYGETFLTMSSDANIVADTTVAITKMLIEIMQDIRYNRPTIQNFLALTTALLQDMVDTIDISYFNNHYIVNYHVIEDYPLANKVVLYAIWQNVVRMKFKLFELSETF